jgi:glutaminase
MPIQPTDGPYEVSEALCDWLLSNLEQPEEKGAGVAGIPGVNSDRSHRSLSLLNLDSGRMYTAYSDGGNTPYSQQSMSKAFAACFLMSDVVCRMSLSEFTTKLGNMYSGLPYNGINLTNGIPTNYSDNIGAIEVWGLIYDKLTTSAVHRYLQFMKKLTGNDQIYINKEMSHGEFSFQPAGGAIPANWHILANRGRAKGTHVGDRTYHSYTDACGIMLRTQDAAMAFGTIANRGVHPRTKEQLIPANVAEHVFNGLADHGAYDESRYWYSKVLLHSKTGVDGGIMGTLEAHRRMVISGRHPDLNMRGNSIEVLKWIKKLATWRLYWPSGRPRYGDLPENIVTGKALHDLLKSQLTDAGVRQLEAAISARSGQANQAYYLKLNPKLKDRAAEGGVVLMEAEDRNHVRKRYYYIADPLYRIPKIVVEYMDVVPEGTQRSSRTA